MDRALSSRWLLHAYGHGCFVGVLWVIHGCFMGVSIQISICGLTTYMHEFGRKKVLEKTNGVIGVYPRLINN